MKNKTKRLLLITALFAALSLLSGCQGKASAAENEKTAYEYGMELVATAAEMAKNENFGAVYSSSEEIQAFTEKIAAGNYETPSFTYQISLPAIDSIAASLGASDLCDGLSETLREQLNHRAF